MMIRWGMIGCGAVTEVKSGPALQQAQGSALVAVMRRNGALAADYARRHGVAKWSDDADDIIHDPEVDAVYVATPPDSHLEYGLRVAAAGKPCYVEKPIARSAAEGRRLVAAFAAAGLPLFVAYYRRGLPRFLQARALVANGRLGPLTHIHYRYTRPTHDHQPEALPWRLVAEQAGGGFFMDLGSHTLDILDFMVGPLLDVAGTAVNRSANYQVEDGVAMSFRTADGALGTAAWDFCGVGSEDMIELVGRNGRLSLSTFGSEPVRLETADGVETFDLPNPKHIQQPLIQSIVAELLGVENGRCVSTGASALRTAQVQDTVLASYYGGRDDPFWLRPETWGHRD